MQHLQYPWPPLQHIASISSPPVRQTVQSGEEEVKRQAPVGQVREVGEAAPALLGTLDRVPHDDHHEGVEGEEESVDGERKGGEEPGGCEAGGGIEGGIDAHEGVEGGHRREIAKCIYSSEQERHAIHVKYCGKKS